MTTRERSRTFLVGAAVAALLAPLAVVAAMASPASAAQMKQHEVYMYKVEKQVDLEGEFPDQNLRESVSCNPGDIALDGMWRVDNVDQANPPETYGDERDVYFSASYGDQFDKAKWNFRATNFADGRAQIKLFATCIRGNVEQAFVHSHGVEVSDRYTVGSGSYATPNDYSLPSSTSCPAGTYAVAPGFNVTSQDYGKKVRIFRSWPTPNYRGWQWAFVVEDPVNIDVYFRCLSTKVLPAGSGPHSHQLFTEWRPYGYAGRLDNLSVVRTQERRLNCDDGSDGRYYQNYKLMVGAFWINDPRNVWYLGMDPRPKQRAFRYWWTGSGDSGVYHAGLCIRARTGKQIAP
ncbi:hypothetical protein GCM10027062_13110 [Nocardioides hungaricus]